MATYRKKLIEVALPLDAINKASAREKSIRHGHPSTLHLWWARRPLAACRAVLFASLVNDPSDDPMYGVSEEIAASERAKLFNLIEELVVWENSNDPRVIAAARAEIARSIAANKVADGEWSNDEVIVTVDGKSASAHDFKHKLATAVLVNAFLSEHAPPVLDPFCGGGSIPLEAQRFGLRACASDLNPVAVLITKALVEFPSRFADQPPVNPQWQTRSAVEKAATVWLGAQGLAEDVRYYGQWMRDKAEKSIGHLYPNVKITKEMTKDRPDLNDLVGQELTVIAWLWARTVASPNPATRGAHVPLVKSFWLSTKPNHEAWIEAVIDDDPISYHFVVRTGKPPKLIDPKRGTVQRTGATCLLSKTPIPFDYIRSEGRAGRISTRLMAIVAQGPTGRIYLDPSPNQELASRIDVPEDVPDTDLPEKALGFRVQLYGINKHKKLFSARQIVTLRTLANLIPEAHSLIEAVQSSLPKCNLSLSDGGDGSRAYADAIVTYLAFAIDKASEGSTTLCTWSPLPTKLHVVSTFGRQAFPMVWDYAEANPFADSSGNFGRMTELVSKVLQRQTLPCPEGHVEQQDAAAAEMAKGTIVCTDPPYYDNIGYADLSDFFYVWLRRSLSPYFASLLSTVLTPKKQELIATPFRHGDDPEAARAFFEHGLLRCFESTHDAANNNYPLTIFYAFKQSEEDSDDEDGESRVVASTGWETILEAVIRSGFLLDGTWPMRTERAGGFRNKGQNALASSIVLVCRPRPPDASLATRKDFLSALHRDLPLALKELQHGNIAPVDLAQAAIGPGMAVFTRYAKVIEADGSPMTVRTALATINSVLDEVLAEQEGDFDADTRWALSWFEQFGIEEGPFGVAETLSKAKNTSVGGMVEAGICKAKSGKVRLLRREEMNAKWDPATDGRLTAWEITQHLIRTLQTDGETAAAELVQRLGGLGETARDLAYRLYNVCERKKWADEALAYNSLVIAWPEISKLALSARARTTRQRALEI